MRTHWLGVVALLLTAGCTHDGQLRPQTGAVPVTEEGTAAVTGEHGVTLVAYGSSWKGQPRNLERHFTPIEVRLENRSGRPLSLIYEGFELHGQKHYTARDPKVLGDILAARDTNYRPPRDMYSSTPRTPTRTYQPDGKGMRPPPSVDTRYSSNSGVSPYVPPPCYTCASLSETAALPTPDMLRQALGEGPLEDGQSRQGFVYFEESLRLDNQVTLKVKLMDATTGEVFGTLSVPFEVH